MKKFGIYLLIAFGILVAGYFIFNPKPKPPIGIFGSDPSPTPESTSQILSYNDRQYLVSWFEVKDIDNLELIPNYSEKLNASVVREKMSCKQLANAGFYLENGQPVGYFASQGETLRGWQKNDLFDGVLSVNEMAIPRITRDVPRDSLRIGLQTGPVLIENSFARKLSIRNDKPARRVVIAVTGENKLFFLTVYSEAASFDGPYLADLPEILEVAEKNIGQGFADAINLDGGSASAFYAHGVTLSELSPVGSFFCVK